jgi:hypothetical protein
MRELMMVAALSVLVWATTLAVPSGMGNQFHPTQIAGDVGPGGGY